MKFDHHTGFLCIKILLSLRSLTIPNNINTLAQGHAKLRVLVKQLYCFRLKNCAFKHVYVSVERKSVVSTSAFLSRMWHQNATRLVFGFLSRYVDPLTETLSS